jgi:hypothetical protein
LFPSLTYVFITTGSFSSTAIASPFIFFEQKRKNKKNKNNVMMEHQIQTPFSGMEQNHNDANKRVPMNPDEAKLFDFLHFELKQTKINAKYYCKGANNSTTFEVWRNLLGS